MNSHDLTAAQLEQLQAKIVPMLRYLNHLQSRMERRGFPVDDELYRADYGVPNGSISD